MMLAAATSATNDNGVKFSIGNTYKRLSQHEAPLDRTGRHRKIHDWTVFVDIHVGDVDIINNVSFDMNSSSFSPQKFICKCPVKIESMHAPTKWRFSSRQTTFGTRRRPINIIIRGRGGAVKTISYNIVFGPMNSNLALQDFTETRALKEFIPYKIADNKFGIELELSCSHQYSLSQIVNHVYEKTQLDVSIISSWSQGRASSYQWKIVPDESIQCNRNEPDCNKFELVSPILTGQEGLAQIQKILNKGFNQLSSSTIKVNKSMGFHVHINVGNRTLDDLKKICINFVKYEDAFDSFMPPSRRRNTYCQSNKLAVGSNNKARKDRILACNSLSDLCHVMNPQGRYYKLNLENLRTGRQQTIEFRQHSATFEYKKSSYWVRFCMAFVMNSVKYKTPKALKEGTNAREQFEKLFMYVIKDRAIRDYYLQRQHSFNPPPIGTSQLCCDDCSTGESREVGRYPRHF